MNETLTLRPGYSRAKSAPSSTYRPMTIREAKQLRYGDTVPFFANDGTARECRINGAPKTWKRRNDVEIPVKYGMYECARLTGSGADTDPVERLLVLIDGPGPRT